jgi:hypothetical protein
LEEKNAMTTVQDVQNKLEEIVKLANECLQEVQKINQDMQSMQVPDTQTQTQTSQNVPQTGGARYGQQSGGLGTGPAQPGTGTQMGQQGAQATPQPQTTPGKKN